MNKEITSQDLHQQMQDNKLKNYVIIDVRSQNEHKSINISEAINIPLEKLQEHKSELEKYDKIFVHCRSGVRSQEGCKILSNLKNAEVINIKGGILDWESQGLAVNKNKKFHIPIFRQVLIISGTLIFLGTILSTYLDPNWMYLSQFVSLGLIFAGATGFCTLAKLLEKLPWNN